MVSSSRRRADTAASSRRASSTRRAICLVLGTVSTPRALSSELSSSSALLSAFWRRFSSAVSRWTSRRISLLWLRSARRSRSICSRSVRSRSRRNSSPLARLSLSVNSGRRTSTSASFSAAPTSRVRISSRSRMAPSSAYRVLLAPEASCASQARCKSESGVIRCAMLTTPTRRVSHFSTLRSRSSEKRPITAAWLSSPSAIVSARVSSPATRRTSINARASANSAATPLTVTSPSSESVRSAGSSGQRSGVSRNSITRPADDSQRI